MCVYIVKYENVEWAQKGFTFICYLLFLKKKKVWIKNGKMLGLKK